ncbi:hypothetical protein FHT03_002555 [Xanthomonas arboricola]|nr:hypothetical protein [Xanthomonas cannabis]
MAVVVHHRLAPDALGLDARARARNGRVQPSMAMMRSTEARIGTSAGAVAKGSGAPIGSAAEGSASAAGVRLAAQPPVDAAASATPALRRK